MDFLSITESTYSENKHKNDWQKNYLSYDVDIFETNQENEDKNSFLEKSQALWEKRFEELLKNFGCSWTKLNRGNCLIGTLKLGFAINTQDTKLSVNYQDAHLGLVKGTNINKNNFHLALLTTMYERGWELKHFTELPERHWTFQREVSTKSTGKRIKSEE